MEGLHIHIIDQRVYRTEVIKISNMRRIDIVADSTKDLLSDYAWIPSGIEFYAPVGCTDLRERLIAAIELSKLSNDKIM